MCIWVLACVCLWSHPVSHVCVSAEHKAVCSKATRWERANTLPREPLTHDPAGLSAPLNMTIHPLHGTRVCVCVFPFWLCTCMDVCLLMFTCICALNAHVYSKHVLQHCERAHRPMCRRECSDATLQLTDWSLHSAVHPEASSAWTCVGIKTKINTVYSGTPWGRRRDGGGRGRKEAGIKSSIKITSHRKMTQLASLEYLSLDLQWSVINGVTNWSYRVWVWKAGSLWSVASWVV